MLVINYFWCKIIVDRKYFLFDNVFVIFVKCSKVDMYLEVFDCWNSYMSMIVYFVNFYVFYLVVSGFFVEDFKYNKEK